LRRDIGLTGHILKKLKISRECTSASERWWSLIDQLIFLSALEFCSKPGRNVNIWKTNQKVEYVKKSSSMKFDNKRNSNVVINYKLRASQVLWRDVCSDYRPVRMIHSYGKWSWLHNISVSWSATANRNFLNSNWNSTE
jgi:hypothetical protein